MTYEIYPPGAFICVSCGPRAVHPKVHNGKPAYVYLSFDTADGCEDCRTAAEQCAEWFAAGTNPAEYGVEE